MPKYDKEHATFTKLKAHFEKEQANAYLWSEVFMGWETQELRDHLKELQELTGVLIQELDTLLTLVEKRRAE